MTYQLLLNDVQKTALTDVVGQWLRVNGPAHPDYNIVHPILFRLLWASSAPPDKTTGGVERGPGV